MNALKHGMRSGDAIAEQKQIRALLRELKLFAKEVSV